MTNSKSVAVVDFGSSKISVMVGERAINDTYNIGNEEDESRYSQSPSILMGVDINDSFCEGSKKRLRG